MMSPYPKWPFIFPHIKEEALLYFHFFLDSACISNDLDRWESHSFCIVNHWFSGPFSLVMESFSIFYTENNNMGYCKHVILMSNNLVSLTIWGLGILSREIVMPHWESECNPPEQLWRLVGIMTEKPDSMMVPTFCNVHTKVHKTSFRK